MESARGTLQKIVAEMIRQCPPEQAPVAAWQFVCGKAVADRTEALSFTEGVLSVRVADVTWRSQLADMTPHYLELLRRYTGQKIERLSFVLPDGHTAGKRSPK
jgi:predicted nucleic acid-binding Zn ribbon protein